MWKYFSLVIAVMVCFTKDSIGQECPIIPLPNQVVAGDAYFTVNQNTAVLVENSAFTEEANYLKNKVLSLTGIAAIGKGNAEHKIVFRSASKGDVGDKGAYKLKMNKDYVIILAADKEGAFNGAVSLLQLIAKEKETSGEVKVHCWNITDQPHYSWRGFMLDESRHFFGKKVVKEVLDQMAWLKLNRFHWHLTDAPAWRLEIKGYPLLTLVGGVGSFTNPFAPTEYYTQDDIREIIAYAEARHIKVIPEIDMPGHATAANSAYPEFSGGGTGKYANFTFNPGKEGTYQYLTNILKEIAVLFPSQMIHLGGDEVSFGIKSWNDLKGVEALMEKEKLTSLKDVEHYFFDRMADSSLKIFDKVLAWDEAVDASLPQDKSIILWWRHDQPQQLKKALEKGYQVILCPRIPLYFDFVQDESHRSGRRWGGKFSSVKQVYQFADTTYLNPGQENTDLIIGMQANLWAETIGSKKRLEFLIFPRLDALAEAAWTLKENKSYKNFLSRLKPQLELYKKARIYYFNPMAPKQNPEVIDFY